jgi:hypothetical protein
MRLGISGLVVCWIVALAASSQAEPFEFAAQMARGQQVRFLRPDGTASMALTQKGTIQTTVVGHKINGNADSIVWVTQAPDLTGIVQIQDAEGSYSILFHGRSASNGAQSGEGWGEYSGISGKYKGRTGASSWHFSEVDNMSTIIGSGHWNDQ